MTGHGDHNMHTNTESLTVSTAARRIALSTGANAYATAVALHGGATFVANGRIYKPIGGDDVMVYDDESNG